MPVVFIPPSLQDLSQGMAQIEVSGENVRQLINSLEERFPGFHARLCSDGELAPSLQVSVDGVMTSRGLFARVQPESEVHFLPALGGG